MSSAANGPKARGSYTVGFICALNLEMSAVRYLLDCEHPSLPPQAGDSNLYILGELSGYNIVLAWLPGNQGKGAAATVATNLNRSFPAIEWRFLVGIGGGVPSDSHDIRLGDVVISMPEGQHGGVVQYDLGKDEEGGFKLKGFLLPPPAQLRNAVVLMQSNHLIAENKIESFINQMTAKSPRLSIYRRPPSEEDVLFAIDYAHDTNQPTCRSCDRQMAVHRRARDADRPEIHYGLIASGDRVMRSAAKRQATVRHVGDILCFEMEAAGILIEYPCIAIRGISDYSDSHKNDRWQYYAAATAAAAAKELLSCIPVGTHGPARENDSSTEYFAPQRGLTAGLDLVALQQSKDCAKSLAFAQMNDRSNNLSISAAEGTCRWLLRHEVCANWSHQDRALLWIKGKPGSGKSTLLRWFLDERRREDIQAGSKSLILSFFFHGRGVELEKTPLGLFRSLLHQLLNQVPKANLDLVRIFQERCDTMGEPGECWQWNLRELQEAFRSATSKILEHRNVWLFVDALDECGKRHASELVRHLKQLLASIPPKSFQFLICLTCRHYPILDLGSAYEIALEGENAADISAYVRAELPRMNEKAASRIADLITAKANGIFLWASIVVDRANELNVKGASPAKIEENICLIPQELYAMYRGLIQEIEDRPKSRKLIQWICFATQPLSLDELRWVLAIDADHASPVKTLKQAQTSDDYTIDSARMERQLRSLSCGLVEIVNKRVAQFIHQSVRDFFVERGISALDDSASLSENDSNHVIGMAHYEISRTCIRYMTMEEIVEFTASCGGLISEFPLLWYAATFWVIHAKESEKKGISQEDLLIYFEWPSTRLVQACLRIRQIIPFLEGYSPKMTNMLHMLSRFELISPLKQILRATNIAFDVNSRDIDGRTPLSWAALMGHEGVVELLLNTDKIDVNAGDLHGLTPLSWAASMGHEGIVKLLLNTDKVDVNARDTVRHTPLLWAATCGHRNVVELMLANENVNAEVKSFSGQTPLSNAAENGHIAIVELLVATNRANLDLQDAEGKTALYYAVREGRLQVAELLIRAGANTGIIGTRANIGAAIVDGSVPLNVAIRMEKVEFVKLLLEAGAELQAKDESGVAPWQVANTSANTEIRLLVLDRALHTEVPDMVKWTILDSFGSEGYLKTLEELLNMGSDTEIPDMYGRTVLMSASRRNHTEAVQLLLKGGAEVSASSEDGLTALHAACNMGHVEVLKVLLEKGANIEASDRHGRTPLYDACYKGHIAIMRVLLEKGANIEAWDEHEPKLLYAACDGGSVEAIKLLLQKGANIEAMEGAGVTPLIYAASMGRTQAVKTLLEAGADIEAVNHDKKTALSVACETVQTRLVKLLLGNGADTASTNKDGWRPLHTASYAGNTEVVKLLVESGADVEAKICTLMLSECASGSGRFEALAVQREDGRGIGSADVSEPPEDKETDLWSVLDGGTALHLASAGGVIEICRILLQHGACVNAVTLRGWTPVDIASGLGHVDISELLEEKTLNMADEVLGEDSTRDWHPGRCAAADVCYEDVDVVMGFYNRAT